MSNQEITFPPIRGRVKDIEEVVCIQAEVDITDITVAIMGSGEMVSDTGWMGSPVLPSPSPSRISTQHYLQKHDPRVHSQ